MQITKAWITEEQKTQAWFSKDLRYANTTHFENRCQTQGISYTNYPLTQITGQLKCLQVKEALSQIVLPNLTKRQEQISEYKSNNPPQKNPKANKPHRLWD